MQTPIGAPVFLPRYQEPCKFLTNPRWCPYTKGSPCEGKAVRASNSVDSHNISGALLPVSLGRSLLSSLSIF
jgi:hypothetical protein